MRYHFTQSEILVSSHSYIHRCDHPVYNKCSLFLDDDGKGLAVIQQRFNPKNKHTYWSSVEPGLCEDLYSHEGFKEYFNTHAALPDNDIYPTVPVRKVMWALRMKPLKKERWETTFDHLYV